MSSKSFPVAWRSGPYRFIGKALVNSGCLHLTGATTGDVRRRRALRLDGCDIFGAYTHRVAGQPGLIVDHRVGSVEIELLAGSWGAAHELARVVEAISTPPPEPSEVPHHLFRDLPDAVANRCVEASEHRTHQSPHEEVQ